MKTVLPKDKIGDDARELFSRTTVPASFQLDGTLDGTETVTFELLGVDEQTASAWVDEYGDAVEFTADKTRPIPVFSPLDLLVTKPNTVNDVGIKLVQ